MVNLHTDTLAHGDGSLLDDEHPNDAGVLESGVIAIERCVNNIVSIPPFLLPVAEAWKVPKIASARYL